MNLRSLEENVRDILLNKEHPFHKPALHFVKYCRELLKSEAGRGWLSFMCGLAHPLRHSPCSDPVTAAHLNGRSEVTALIYRFGCPPEAAIIPAPVPDETDKQQQALQALWQTYQKQSANDAPPSPQRAKPRQRTRNP